MNNLKNLRLKQKLTQKDVAKIINVAPTTYLGYEKGLSEPTIATLIKLANYFDVSLDFLCERDNQTQIGYIPEDRKQLIRYLINAPYSVINQVEIFLKGYNSGKSEQQQVNFYTPDEL